jgi:hypothetical protein
MAKVFQWRERQENLSSRSGRSLKEVMVDQLGWLLDTEVFVLYAPEHGYQTNLAVFLEYHERFFTYFDTGVVCHPTDQNVVVFWDGTGPYYGKRRD